MKIPKSLLVTGMNAYSDQGALRKQKFHTDGKKFLKELAALLGVSDKCDIRSNVAGIAVSGEVTLHADHLYVQLSESSKPGISILYRSCEHRKDYCGGQNNFTTMQDLAGDEDAQNAFVARCKRLMAAAEAAAKVAA
jgi:HD superfamily phosphohydrolase YqeK